MTRQVHTVRIGESRRATRHHPACTPETCTYDSGDEDAVIARRFGEGAVIVIGRDDDGPVICRALHVAKPYEGSWALSHRCWGLR